MYYTWFYEVVWLILWEFDLCSVPESTLQIFGDWSCIFLGLSFPARGSSGAGVLALPSLLCEVLPPHSGQEAPSHLQSWVGGLAWRVDEQRRGGRLSLCCTSLPPPSLSLVNLKGIVLGEGKVVYWDCGVGAVLVLALHFSNACPLKKKYLRKKKGEEGPLIIFIIWRISFKLKYLENNPGHSFVPCMFSISIAHRECPSPLHHHFLWPNPVFPSGLLFEKVEGGRFSDKSV